MHVDEFVPQGSVSSPGDELISLLRLHFSLGQGSFLTWALSSYVAFGTSPGGRAGGGTSCCCEKLAALPLLPNEVAAFVLCCSVQVLTLASNERIALTPSMKLLFEIHHLRTATPATVSRAGILYVNPQDLGWNP